MAIQVMDTRHTPMAMGMGGGVEATIRISDTITTGRIITRTAGITRHSGRAREEEAPTLVVSIALVAANTSAAVDMAAVDTAGADIDERGGFEPGSYLHKIAAATDDSQRAWNANTYNCELGGEENELMLTLAVALPLSYFDASLPPAFVACG